MRDNFKDKKRIVLKIGTSSITYENGKLNHRKIEKLSIVLTDLINSGKEIILVSSGAIGAGIGRLGLSEKPLSIEMKQATAAIGQAYLMQIYQRNLSELNQVCAQVLLTRDVIDDEQKQKNVINTMNQLLALSVLPIVNENDTVSTDEIIGSKFTDNDNLSSIVAVISDADLLVILSDIDGLYKRVNGCLTTEVIPLVEEINEDVFGNVSESISGLGTGGMGSKLSAADYAMNAGIDTVICNSKDLKVIYDVLEGKTIGTLFRGK